MNSMYEVFNVKSDLQLNNILSKLDLNPSEMIKMDEIISQYGSIKDKRTQLLELMASSSDENYNICESIFSSTPSKKRVLKEDMEGGMPSQLNMNQAIQLNNLFELASKKFQEVECSQAFYSMLSQKLSKNFANAFFNTLKSNDESSQLKYNPELVVDGKNFADTIFPLVNELTNYLNSCKNETKEDIKEAIETQPDMFGGPDTYYKDGIEALDFDNVLDAVQEIDPKMDLVDTKVNGDKATMIFQPSSKELDKALYKKIKDGLKAKFGADISVRLAHAQYAPEIKKLYVSYISKVEVQNELENKEELNESLEDTLNNFKYFISTSSDKKELQYIKDKLSILFNECRDTEDRNNIAELLSQINSKMNTVKPTVEECCGIDSLLEPFKTSVINITINDEGCCNDDEKEFARNNLKALASHVNDTKDCCEENNIERMQTITSLLSSLANFFHKRLCESVEDNKLANGEYTVVAYNIVVDDYFEGEYNLHEKKVLKINHKAGRDLDKEIKEAIIEDMGAGDDIKVVDYDYQIVDNVADDELFESVDENMENAIESVNAQIDDFGSYHDEIVRSYCEDVAKYYNVDVKKLYYYVTNHKWSIWDKDEDYEELDESYDEKYNDVREELNYIKQRYLNGELDVYDATNEVDGLIGDKSNAEAIVDSWDDSSKHGLYGINNEALLNKISNDPNVYIQGRDEIDDGQEPDVEKILDSIKYIANTYNKTFNEAKEIYSEISYTDVYSIEELDEDTVYDHSWYEVKGQKYPKRTKNGVEIKEDFKSSAKKLGRNIHKGLDKIHNATVKAGQKLGLGLSNEQLYEYINEYLIYVFMFIYGMTDPDNSSFKQIYNTINGTDWNMENVHRFVMKIINNRSIMKEAEKDPETVAKYMKYQLTHYGIDRKIIDKAWDTFVKEELNNQIDEMCSGGACCAGAVATIPSPVKPKSPKKKKKKAKVEEIALNMFKRHIIEGINSQITVDGNHYEYCDGYLYINGNIAKTKSKYLMLEALDDVVELETLQGFNSEEMKLLEDIEASGSVGNDNEQDNSNNNNNTGNSANNTQNSTTPNSNVNQNTLGDVQQNVTQDNDLTPEQRQLKKDTEKTLDQTMKGSSDVDVSINQGMDNNNDQLTNNQSQNNVKYKLIGKDDSDQNNIKYIVQDPTTKETQVVDATKLRLEK